MRFASKERRQIADWKKRIVMLRAQGRVGVWGAGAKGVTFVNLVDPGADLIDCVVDLNPHKQGGYLPGTGHKIVPFTELPRRKVKTAILMNPNYYRENRGLVRKAGFILRFVQ
jgi:hypothetical protein